MESIRPKIGLALGSGGARGLAHIGVLKTLAKHGVPIDCIAGSSIGALIGGLYAAGMSIAEVEAVALDTNWRTVFSVLFEPKLDQGLIGGEKVGAFITSLVGTKRFNDCRIPFAAVATDLKTADAVVFSEGEIAKAIRASISVPLIFKPVEHGNMLLADGGLSSPVPVSTARALGADIVIAVNLDTFVYDDESRGMYGVANNSLGILRHHLSRLAVASADIVIDMNLGKSYWYQFLQGEEKILAGARETEEKMPALLTLMREKGAEMHAETTAVH